MPSPRHDALVDLFRYRPMLASELLCDALKVDLPRYVDARIHCADLTEAKSAEFRADLVVLFEECDPVLGVVVEVQLSRDNHKRYSWPVYVANLRARLKCPVGLLVVTLAQPVARWAVNPIDLGWGSRVIIKVVGPDEVPGVPSKFRTSTNVNYAASLSIDSN